jgi:hypothetical protein
MEHCTSIEGIKVFTDVVSWPKKNCIGESQDGSCRVARRDFGLLKHQQHRTVLYTKNIIIYFSKKNSINTFAVQNNQ